MTGTALFSQLCHKHLCPPVPIFLSYSLSVSTLQSPLNRKTEEALWVQASAILQQKGLQDLVMPGLEPLVLLCHLFGYVWGVGWRWCLWCPLLPASDLGPWLPGFLLGAERGPGTVSVHPPYSQVSQFNCRKRTSLSLL